MSENETCSAASLVFQLASLPSSENDAEVEISLRGAIDWAKLERLVSWHRLEGLVLQGIDDGCLDGVPESFESGLRTSVAEIGLRNLAMTRCLIDVLACLDEAGISAIPFKGPMLALTAYGDPALRHYDDLDLLIAKADFAQAEAALSEMGYRRAVDREETDEAFLETQMGLELWNPESGVVLELHWAFLNRVHAFGLDPEEVWQRAVVCRYGGRDINSMANEDLLIYLCAHGTKSFWERGIWIADIARLIDSCELDWDRVEQLASEIRARRLVGFGVSLASELLGAKVPSLGVRDDAAVRQHVERVKARLLSGGTEVGDAERRRIHLEMPDRVADRVPYLVHLARIKAVRD